MATQTEPATSAIFRALRSVDVDPDLVLIPNSYRWAFFVPFSVVFQFGLGVAYAAFPSFFLARYTNLGCDGYIGVGKRSCPRCDLLSGQRGKQAFFPTECLSSLFPFRERGS